jgi:hypothetical protein
MPVDDNGLKYNKCWEMSFTELLEISHCWHKWWKKVGRRCKTVI